MTLVRWLSGSLFIAGMMLADEPAKCRLVPVYGKPVENAGDGGPATEATFFGVGATRIGPQGEVYVASGRRIRRVDPDGTVSTFAGSGEHGYAGDGGPAAEAKIRTVNDLTLDGQGNLYFTDSMSHVVRRVATDGTITTIAGTGAAGWNGDDRPGSEAQLNTPLSVAADRDGNVYISDSLNRRVRRVGVDGRIATVAGTGAPGFTPIWEDVVAVEAAIEPRQLAMTASGEPIVLNGLASVHRIGADGQLRVVAGGGSQLAAPEGDARRAGLQMDSVWVHPNGEIWLSRTASGIGDPRLTRWARIDGEGKLAVVPGATTARPLVGFTADGDPLTFNASDGTMQRLTEGVLRPWAGAAWTGFQEDGLPAAEGLGASVLDVAAGPDGSVYFPDSATRKVRRVSPEGIVSTIHALPPPEANRPASVAVDGKGSVYVADSLSRIWKLEGETAVRVLGGPNAIGFTSFFGSAPAADSFISGIGPIWADGSGNLFFTSLGISGYWTITATDGNVNRRSGGNPTSILGQDGAQGIWIVQNATNTVRVRAEGTDERFALPQNLFASSGQFGTQPATGDVYFLNLASSLLRITPGKDPENIFSQGDPDNVLRAASPPVRVTKMVFDSQGDLLILDNRLRIRKLVNPGACGAAQPTGN